MTTKAKKAAKVLRRRSIAVKRKGWLQESGPMRIGLWFWSLLVLFLAPKPGTAVVYSGWEMIPTLMAPVLAPILLQVVLLDALMSRVWMSAHTGAARDRYKRLMWINLVVAGFTMLGWLPYFSVLLRGKGFG